MARLFGTTGDRLNGGDIFDAPTMPFFAAAWFKQKIDQSTGVVMGRLQPGQEGWKFASHQWNSTHDIGLTIGPTPATDDVSSLAVALDTWFFGGVIATTTNYHYFRYDLTTFSTDDNSVTAATPGSNSQSFAIGATRGNSDGEEDDAEIAWVMFAENFSPTDDQIKEFAHYPMAFQREASLAADDHGLWPIIGASPEPDWSGKGRNMTVVGTPAVVAGPPIASQFRPVTYSFPTAAAAAGNHGFKFGQRMGV